jgi:hypothetical protein
MMKTIITMKNHLFHVADLPTKKIGVLSEDLQGGEVFQLGVTLQQQGRVLGRRHLLLAPGHGRFSVLFVWLKISDGKNS